MSTCLPTRSRTSAYEEIEPRAPRWAVISARPRPRCHLCIHWNRSLARRHFKPNKPNPALRTCAPLPRSRRTCTRQSCPGSTLIKHRADAEGLNTIFKREGIDWCKSGCGISQPVQTVASCRCGQSTQQFSCTCARPPFANLLAHPPTHKHWGTFGGHTDVAALSGMGLSAFMSSSTPALTLVHGSRGSLLTDHGNDDLLTPPMPWRRASPFRVLPRQRTSTSASISMTTRTPSSRSSEACPRSPLLSKPNSLWWVLCSSAPRRRKRCARIRGGSKELGALLRTKLCDNVVPEESRPAALDESEWH